MIFKRKLSLIFALVCSIAYADTQVDAGFRFNSKTYLIGACEANAIIVSDNDPASDNYLVIEMDDTTYRPTFSITKSDLFRKAGCIFAVMLMKSNVDELHVLNGGIGAESSNIAGVVVTTEANTGMTPCFFEECYVGRLTTTGSGQAEVRLINSHAQTIEFKDNPGVVKVIGRSFVKNVINGTVEYVDSIAK